MHGCYTHQPYHEEQMIMFEHVSNQIDQKGVTAGSTSLDTRGESETCWLQLDRRYDRPQIMTCM